MPTPTENAPLPVTDYAPRCRMCGAKLAVIVTRPWRIICHNKVDRTVYGRNNCKTLNESEPGGG